LEGLLAPGAREIGGTDCLLRIIYVDTYTQDKNMTKVSKTGMSKTLTLPVKAWAVIAEIAESQRSDLSQAVVTLVDRYQRLKAGAAALEQQGLKDAEQ